MAGSTGVEFRVDDQKRIGRGELHGAPLRVARVWRSGYLAPPQHHFPGAAEVLENRNHKWRRGVVDGPRRRFLLSPRSPIVFGYYECMDVIAGFRRNRTDDQ